MIVLETVQYNEKYELKARERHHLETLGATLNSQTPGRTKAEWCADTEYNKRYYEQNKEKEKQRTQQYRENNMEKVQEYREHNMEKINQRGIAYREQNKIKINQKHTCDCGGKFCNANKARHMKSKKQVAYIEKE